MFKGLTLLAATFLVSCSYLQDDLPKVDGWEVYSSNDELKSNQVKPLSVVYDGGSFVVNGNALSADSAVNLIKKSQKLSPTPDILIIFKMSDFTSMIPFMNKIRDGGLCAGRRCSYKIVN